MKLTFQFEHKKFFDKYRKENMSWSYMTEEALQGVLYLADKKLIDLEKDLGWKIGDKREVKVDRIKTFSTANSWLLIDGQGEQTIKLVLMNKGGYYDREGKEVNYVVGMDGCLLYSMNLDSFKLNREWCNKVFMEALPKGLRPIFREFKYKMYSRKKRKYVTLKDYFTLPSLTEIIGENDEERGVDDLFQFEYYKGKPNRRFKSQYDGIMDMWITIPYWTRTISKQTIGDYIKISDYLYGDYSSDSRNIFLGMSLIGCI